MNKTVTKDYVSLFEGLESEPILKEMFIEELQEAKRRQKENFIVELMKGTFGKMNWREDEVKKDGINFINMPFFMFVRRLVEYKCANIILDVIEDEAFREKIRKNNAVIFIGGRIFHSYGDTQKQRVKKIIKNDPSLKYSLIFIENYHVFNSNILNQGTDFSGMLSWKGREAGPTGYAKTMVNGSPAIATPDGVIPERLTPVKRDEHGCIIEGDGYLVEYENEKTQNGEILPNKISLMERIEEACTDYKSGNYKSVSFNAFRTGMTKCNVRNQAKGLIKIWANAVGNFEKKNEINLFRF